MTEKEDKNKSTILSSNTLGDALRPGIQDIWRHFMKSIHGKDWKNILEKDRIEKNLKRISFLKNKLKSERKLFNLKEKIIAYCNCGDEKYQDMMVRGVVFGKYGFEQDPSDLYHLAKKDYSGARYWLSFCITFGKHGFSQDVPMLHTLSDLGWEEATKRLILIYTLGRAGISQQPDKLLELANKGLKGAQEKVCIGLTYGIYGFQKDLDELERLANKRWPEALRRVCEGYSQGSFGFNLDHEKLNQRAQEGCFYARRELYEIFDSEKVELKKLLKSSIGDAQS